MKPNSNPPGTKHLKLEYDGLLSNFAFNFNLRRYNWGFFIMQSWLPIYLAKSLGLSLGRGLHSSTFQLNLSCFITDRLTLLDLSHHQCLR